MYQLTGVAGQLAEANAQAEKAKARFYRFPSSAQPGKFLYIHPHRLVGNDSSWSKGAQASTYVHQQFPVYAGLYYEGFNYMRDNPNWKEEWARTVSEFIIKPNSTELYNDIVAEVSRTLPNGEVLHDVTFLYQFWGNGRKPGSIISGYGLAANWGDDIAKNRILAKMRNQSNGRDIFTPVAHILAFTPAAA